MLQILSSSLKHLGSRRRNVCCTINLYSQVRSRLSCPILLSKPLPFPPSRITVGVSFSVGVNMVGAAGVARPLQNVSRISVFSIYKKTYLVVKRRSINSIAAVWAKDNHNIATRGQTIFAINLFLSTTRSRRPSPDINVSLARIVVVVGAFLAIILIYSLSASRP